METPSMETPNQDSPDMNKCGAFKWENGKLVRMDIGEMNEEKEVAPEEPSVEIDPSLTREANLPETIQKNIERAESELQTAQERLQKMSKNPIGQTIGRPRSVGEKIEAQAASLRKSFAEVNALKEAKSVLEQSDGNVGDALKTVQEKMGGLEEKMRANRAEIDKARGNAELSQKLDEEREQLLELHNQHTATREILEKR